MRRRNLLKSGIYCIKNIITNKIYIGSSINLKNRINEHKRYLSKKTHHSSHLQRSWDKYKEEAFEFNIIERVCNEKLLEREQYWINFYKSSNRKFGYNICPIAGNTLGVKMSEEVKRKTSERTKGEKNPMFGKTHTPEVRKILSDFHTGLKVTDEFREKMSIVTNGENNGMYGRNHSVEAKESIATKLKQRGGYLGEKNPNYGKKWSIEQRKAMSERLLSEKTMAGDNNPNVKIKSYNYPKILNRIRNKGRKAIPFLAKHFGVCPATIDNILKKVDCENY